MARRSPGRSSRITVAIDAPVVLDDWKRIVEMMEELLPALILGRLAKPDGVVLERRPANDQGVLIGPLETFLKLERQKARHRGNDASGLSERPLEVRFPAGNHLQDR